MRQFRPTKQRARFLLLLSYVTAFAFLSSPAFAQGYEIWYHDLPSQSLKVLDSAGQLDRSIPFPFTHDAQFIVAPTRDRIYFDWGTNGWDGQTWQFVIGSPAPTFLAQNEWAVVTGFVPGSSTQFLTSGSHGGEIRLFDVSTNTQSVWQDNDLLASQFGFNAFRYELSLAHSGLALVRAGYASAGGDGLFLADICAADTTHHLCNFRVFANPGGGSSSWNSIAFDSALDPQGRYAFYTLQVGGSHTFRRRTLATGDETILPEAHGPAYPVVHGGEVFFTSPQAGTRTLYACNIETLACRSLYSAPNLYRVQVVAVPDSPPVAYAEADTPVNEGQAGVQLQGGQSYDPDGNALTFLWEQVLDGSPIVQIWGADTATASFTAPFVPVGGATLTFKLTATANGQSATDTVSVSVVNINHPPVAEAGDGRSASEGSPVALNGGASFDVDGDVFEFDWVQVEGPPVLLTNPDSATPTFTAPAAGSGGAPGVVATLVFELRVDDGYTADAPTPGYDLSSNVDRVAVSITNVNNAPVADAGLEQTVNENNSVTLNALASSDPDSDVVTYSWTQTAGPGVTLAGANSATPTFTAPFVDPGGVTLAFAVTVSDGFGGAATDSVAVNVQNVNDPPLASGARPTVAVLWPPNHRMVSVGIVGVSDPDDNATITITSVTQDEPTTGLGDGDTAVDAVINGDGTVLLRAERSGTGDGRVYRVYFTASDEEGSSSGMVVVTVPHNAKSQAVDSGGVYPSTQ